MLQENGDKVQKAMMQLLQETQHYSWLLQEQSGIQLPRGNSWSWEDFSADAGTASSLRIPPFQRVNAKGTAVLLGFAYVRDHMRGGPGIGLLVWGQDLSRSPASTYCTALRTRVYTWSPELLRAVIRRSSLSSVKRGLFQSLGPRSPQLQYS